MFKEAGIESVFWFPHAAEHTCYTPNLKDPNAERMHLPPIPEAWEGRFVKKIPKYDWCFIGHINNDRRIAALDQLAKANSNWHYGRLFFEDAARAFHNSKIVFNICHDRDINMRFFEATSARSCLLTEWLPEFEELGYRHKEHCLFYKSIDEAQELMSEYVDPSKDQERDDIAERGWRKTWAEHTYANRAHDMILLLQLHGYAPAPPELLAIMQSAPPATIQP